MIRALSLLFLATLSTLSLAQSGSVPADQLGSAAAAQTAAQSYAATQASQAQANAISLSTKVLAMTGLYYWYPMTDNQGTTITDASGNGNNVTESGGTPIWVGSVGLQMNGGHFTIPNAAGRPTYGLCAYYPAAVPGTFSLYNYFSAPASGGQQGLSVGGSYGSSYGHGFNAYFPVLGVSNGGPVTVLRDGLSGNHCIEWVIGDNAGANDRIFIDGVEGTYFSQGSTYYALGSGELTTAVTISDSLTNGSFPVNPIIYSVWGANTRDTATLAIGRTLSEKDRLSRSGVLFGYPANNAAVDSVCGVDGTSIDFGYEASHPPYTLLSLDFPCTFFPYAISGQDAGSIDAAYFDREANNYHLRGAANIIYNGGVTNSVMNDQESPQLALQDMISWSRKARKQGYRTIAATMISRTGTGYNNLSGDVLAQQFNALLIASSEEFDWIANPAAAPQLGATNANTNATYFNSDMVHPIDAGQAYIVAAMRAAYEGLYYTKALTPVSAAYTQVASDRQVIASGTSAYVITLMDANTANFGRNARTCFKNLNTANVTLTPVNAETIDGSTSLIIAPGATACLVPYIVNPAAGGANWVRVQ